MSANQVRRIEELQGYVRTVDHVKRLVAELESNRAASPQILKGISDNIARDLSHMRHSPRTAHPAPWPDAPGSLPIVAGRQGSGINVEIRALLDGINSLTIQLDQALKQAHDMGPDKDKDEKKKS